MAERAGTGERSIPACAGEPRSAAATRRARGVYPRVCGGTAVAAFRKRSSAGLSPRVRGNRICAPAWLAPLGSIPACAGEPRMMPFHAFRKRVYPRVCGGTASVPGVWIPR